MALEDLDRTQWKIEEALVHVEAVMIAESGARRHGNPDRPVELPPTWLRPADETSGRKQDARDQLLVALRDGDLHARGRYTEERAYSWRASSSGFGLHSGYHSSISPEHWLEGIFDRGRLTGATWEFIDIRVPRFMVLAIWPSHAEQAPNQPAKATSYTTPYLELMHQAIERFGICEANQEKKELLVDWFQRQEIDGEPVSGKLADAMATLVRLPASQRGGARRPLGPEFSRAS